MESQGKSVAVADIPDLAPEFDDIADMQFDHKVVSLSASHVDHPPSSRYR